MSFGIEAFLFLLKLTKHVEKLLHKINKSVKSEREKLAYKQLTNYVEFHSALKQLIKSYINLFILF